MKISILSHDLSHNCLGRAYLLAKILQKKYELEIIGPILGKGIWEPVKNDRSIKYKPIKNTWNIKEVLSLIDGDIIYVIKPKGTSFGYGLLKRLKSKKPLILDIDDWELGFFSNKIINFLYSSANFLNINNAFYTFLLEKFIKNADAITISNSFLQKRFGGTLIPHVKDIFLLNPSLFKKNMLREKYGLNNKKIIMFLGTIREHKGINDLIEAFNRLNRKDVILILVGANFNDPYVNLLLNKSNKDVKFIGEQPMHKVPEFLSIADIIVIPQRYSKASVGQMPTKIYDAMAMAKPIISTKVSDIPNVLNGCGIIVKPGDIECISEKINYLLDNPEIANEFGRKAREKCVRNYSFKSIESRLFKLIDNLINKSNKR